MRARRRAWRALLSALAGGGLTAVTFGGPLPTLAQGEGGWTPIVTTSSGTTATSQSAASTAPAQTTKTARESDWESATTSSASTTHTGVTQVRTQTQTVTSVEAPAVVLQRRQKSTAGTETGVTSTTGSTVAETEAEAAAAAGNNVAEAPQIVAAQLGGLEDELAGAAATSQALSFYRIPLFLLPIYQAAAVQYGVPWQILAAINEIETDYGNDLSVSTAGAVGWMQFMPSTWLQYGVDALDAGYADPYNPVDAVFAAARYLKAAGAATDLSGAILSYNHSQAYVQSVLLRAKLISAYPGGVIATLTGLTDGHLPVTGTAVHWGQPIEPAEAATTSPATTAAQSASSATAKAAAVAPAALVAQAPGAGVAAGSKALSPTAAAAATKPAATGREFVELTTAPGAHVVAVQDGRITGIGTSRRLGHYLILRDVYGDVFTYAGLGSIASSYLPPKPARTASAPAASPNGSTTTTSTSSSAGSSAASTTPETTEATETTETTETGVSRTAAASSVEAGQPAESGQPIEQSGQSDAGAEPALGATAGKGLALLVVAPQGAAAAGSGAGESLLAHAAALADSAAVADAAAAEFAEVTPVGPKQLFSLAGLIGRGTTASAHTSSGACSSRTGTPTATCASRFAPTGTPARSTRAPFSRAGSSSARPCTRRALGRKRSWSARPPAASSSSPRAASSAPSSQTPTSRCRPAPGVRWPRGRSTRVSLPSSPSSRAAACVRRSARSPARRAPLLRAATSPPGTSVTP
jgi:membrane-bound lytic murein transglycosylase B